MSDAPPIAGAPGGPRDMVALRDAIASGRASARSAVDAYLARAAAAEDLHAYHETFADEARAAADAVDARIRRGESPGPLAGVPIAVKDNIATRTGRTTCSSRMLERYRSPFESTATQRLLDAGAVMIGKTNLDEFAMGSSSERCAWGPVRNPWDRSHVPGGSSGGSAAAVSAGLCAGALGSDTGGSIRQPAAFCGVVGLKPTYGRISRWGLVAFGSSLDQIGPITLSVRDAALLYETMSGADSRDSTCADREVERVSGALDECPRLRVGIPRQYGSGNAPAVDAAVTRAADAFRAAGATIVDVDLPLTDLGISTYYVIAPAEASSNLARFDGIRYGHRAAAGGDLNDLYARSRAEGFGDEVKRRIMLGTWVLSAGYHDAYYLQALKVRRRITQEFDEALARCDVILGPTAPTPAFPIGGRTDPISMYMNDVYTVNTNIAGICGISLPAGTDSSGGPALPIGIQLQAQAFAEPTLLRAARLLERDGGFAAQLAPASAAPAR